MTRITIVDDDAKYGTELAEYLRRQGYETKSYEDPMPALKEVQVSPPDVLLLDLRLELDNGIDVLRKIRENSDVPCLLLADTHDEIERVVGLEIGADDFLCKTLSPREILARLRAVLRRAWKRPPGPIKQQVSIGDWVLSLDRRELYRPDGTACALTTAEFDVLRLLTSSQAQPLSRDEICRHAFNRSHRPGDRAVDMVVVKLRRKIEPFPERPEVIKSVRQMGYVFTGFPTQAK